MLNYSLIAIQLLLAAWYVWLFYRYRTAWADLAETNISSSPFSSHEEVTVLIPFRDEEEHIPALIKSLNSQTYPHARFIFINDHSSDRGPMMIETYCQFEPRAQIIHLQGNQNGKKRAIELALSGVKSKWVLHTDADTQRGPNWIQSMLQTAIQGNAVMVSGPVLLESDESAFGRWQTLEFAGLIGIGAAGIHLGEPSLCNGANILYKTSAFYEVGGYQGNQHIATGDDQFLMHRLAKKYPGQILFCKNKEAIVTTPAKSNIREFIDQRIRWASKNGKFENPRISMEMIGVWLLSFVLVMNFILSPIYWASPIIVLIAFSLKTRAELKFYKEILPFFGRTDLTKQFAISSVIHTGYVFMIGLLSKFVSYTWKGRTH